MENIKMSTDTIYLKCIKILVLQKMHKTKLKYQTGIHIS